MKKYLCLVAITALAAAGCGDDSGRVGRDGGITLPDSGGGVDSGGIMLMDSGGMTTTDSGGGTRECEMPFMPFPAMAAPRCSMETKTCIEGCMDIMCVQACIDADTTPPVMDGMLTLDCDFCIAYSQFYCLDSMGCHDQVSGYFCCAEDSGCMDQMCLQSMCSSQVSALQGCAMTSGCGLQTGGSYAICFP